MPLAASGTLVAEAAAARTAVAAFNVITLEHVEAVVAGAEAAQAPVILQISENAVTFRGGRLLPLARAATVAAEAARVPVGLHLDHVQSDALLRQAADAGFSSVMYDAARLPYAQNLAATRAAADWAHGHGLWIEAELGEVGGKGAVEVGGKGAVEVGGKGAVEVGGKGAVEADGAGAAEAQGEQAAVAGAAPAGGAGAAGAGGQQTDEADGKRVAEAGGQRAAKAARPPLGAHAPGARTDPDEAAAFVTGTGVDALAVAIGSTHAMRHRTAALDHDLLARLAPAAGVPLVLHGSSGVPDGELAAAVAGGIAKVNIGTALNLAMTGALRDFFAAHPDAVDCRPYLTAGRAAMTETVTRLIGVVRGAS